MPALMQTSGFVGCAPRDAQVKATGIGVLPRIGGSIVGNYQDLVKHSGAVGNVIKPAPEMKSSAQACVKPLSVDPTGDLSV